MAGISTPAIGTTSGSGTTDVNITQVGGNAVTTTIPVSGTVTATPTGTQDVNVLDVIPGTSATRLGKAVDSVAGATDTGVAVLGVRDDALSAITPAEGDYSHLFIDANGALWINLAYKLDSTNDSVTADTELPSASTVAADAVTPTVPGVANYNFIKTPGANTWDRRYSIVNATNSTGTGIAAAGLLGQFDDTSPTSITENQFGNLRISTNRNLYGTIRDAAGNERGVNVDSSNQLAVLDSAVKTAVEIMDDWDNGASDGASVSGDVAHDSVDAGEPVKIGMKAYSADGTTPGTAVAENDRTNAKGDLDGRLFTNVRHPRWWSYHSDGSSALTDASVAADPGDGFEIVITEIIFSTGAATACNIFFEEGSTKILGPWYLEATAGRGVMWRGEKHVTASTALTVTTSAAIAQGLDVQGYIQAV